VTLELPFTECCIDNFSLPLGILNKLPDLARGLARIQYGRCTPKELHTFLKAFNKVATTFSSFQTESPDEVGFRSPLLNNLIWALPRLRTAVQALIGEVNLVQLDLQNKSNIWTNVDRWPGIEDAATVSSADCGPIVHTDVLAAERSCGSRAAGRTEEQ
jgi:hypothetical protein